jgi:sec-independent protein translocase protein TatA
MTSLVAFVNSGWSWLIVLFIALLLFGRRLPGVARNLGRGINEFKKGLNDATNVERVDDDADGNRSREGSLSRKTDIDKTSV